MSEIASSTACRMFSSTLVTPLTTLDTVARDTPAALATSSRVTRLDIGRRGTTSL